VHHHTNRFGKTEETIEQIDRERDGRKDIRNTYNTDMNIIAKTAVVNNGIHFSVVVARNCHHIFARVAAVALLSPSPIMID